MNAPRDPELDDLLAESDDLFAQYRALPKSEPPRELDIAILAKAREAVARPRKPSPLRWMVPLASVATLALAAGIGWRVLDAEQRTQVAAEGRASAKEEQIVEFELLDVPNRDAERREMANSPPPPPPPPAPAAAVPPPVQKVAAMPAEAVAEPEMADAFIAERQKSDEVAQPRQTGRDYAEPHLRADHSAPGAPPESDKRKAEMSVGQSAAGSRAASPAAENELAKDQDAAPEVLEPEEWIQKIRDLQLRRRFNEVRKEITEFRKTYPNYPLPDDLARQYR